MIERVVENWLTNAGEREYEVPLTQVLAIKGHEILQGPVHHAHEQGKDLITRAQGGQIWALQLKSGNIDLEKLGKYEPQLWALSHYPIRHPALPESARASRVFLVTNGELTPPARTRLNDLSAQNLADNVAPIEYIERDRLYSMFLGAHGRFLPTEPLDMRRFLELHLDEGSGSLPKQLLLGLIESILSAAAIPAAPKQVSRAISSAVLLCSYALSPWIRKSNHVSMAEGWLLLAGCILRLVGLRRMQPRFWKTSYVIAMESARTALRNLLTEALAAPDLVTGDFTDPFVYGTRALLTCGYSAAFALSESIGHGNNSLLAQAATLCRREYHYINTIGESGAPHIFMISTILGFSDEPHMGANLVGNWARTLAESNAPHSGSGLANPYHSLDEILFDLAGGDEEIREQFSGMAYTLHVSAQWLARREERPLLDNLWPAMSKVNFNEYTPTPMGYLMATDDDGQLTTWAPSLTQSWPHLKQVSRTLTREVLPEVLWSSPEYVPYIALLFPYRLTADLAKALDYFLGLGSIQLRKERRRKKPEL